MNSNEFVPVYSDPDFKYDESRVYARYIVEREFGGWSVIRKNLVTEQGWTAVSYTDEQLANHMAFILNQHTQSERK